MSSNEKLKILKMLEEGKISADEASRLLESVGRGGTASDYSSTSGTGTGSYSGSSNGAGTGSSYGGSSYSSGTSTGYGSQQNNSADTGSYKSFDSGYSGSGSYSGGSSGGQQRPSSHESFAEEMSRKFGTLMRDMEPKIQKFTETVVERTSEAADAISKSFSSTSTPPPPASTYTGARTADRGGRETLCEIVVNGMDNELNLSGVNGQVFVKGYNGDKISAKIYCVPKRGNPRVELMTLGSKYYLDYDENEVERVCIDAFIPDSKFANIRVATINGMISLSNVRTGNIKAENLGGEIELNTVSADNIIIEGNNGKLNLRNTSALQAAFENFGGGIEATGLDVARAKLTTMNGKIDLRIPEFAKYGEYDWTIESSNAPLNMILPSGGVGYEINAHAALSNVKLGLIGLNYLRNDTSSVEARSINYDTATKHVKLKLESSNAVINVN